MSLASVLIEIENPQSVVFLYIFVTVPKKDATTYSPAISPAIPVVISKPLGFAGYIGVSSCLNSFYSFLFKPYFPP